jgi:protein involved in polysaccharide export with SLBB domain/capsular polysaccharide biosynthesis protein
MNQNGHPVNAGDSDARGNGHEYARGRHDSTTSRRQMGGAPPPADIPPVAPGRPGFSVDAWSLLQPAARRWYWLLLGCAAGTLAGAALGISLWTTSYTATAQLVRYDPPVASDAYRPQVLNGPTLVGMLKSPEMLKQMAALMNPPVSPAQLAGSINQIPERNSELVTITATAPGARSAIDLANAFNRAVIEFTQDYQRREAEQADVYVKQHLAENGADIEATRKKMPALSAAAMTAMQDLGGRGPTRGSAALQKAEDELAELLVKFLDNHPAVRAKRAQIAQLMTEAERRTLAGEVPEANLAGSREQWELAFAKLRDLENLQRQLLHRERAIQTFKASPPGNFRVMQAATPDTVRANRPNLMIALLSVFFGMLGLALTGMEVLRREFFDTRLKTDNDVVRVTRLPVIATLGDLRRMPLAAREGWAFRTWIALQDRLAYSPNHGLICGITSSDAGDGRTTWINLLAGAARKCGFRVLTIATRPTADAAVAAEEAGEPAAEAAGAHAANGANGAASAAVRTAHAGATTTHHPESSGGGTATLLSDPADLAGSSQAFASESEFTALTASALFTPAMVTEKLMGSETDPLVHIPLPGWTWNLERRKQWQGALNVWRKIDNVVILVELPPASMPESVLLASNLPNLLWLVESGKSEASATRAQLQTLRHARCNLVGAVINRALAPVTQGKFSRWVGCLAFVAVLGLTGNGLTAGEAAGSPAIARSTGAATFSIVSPAHRAEWQRKLTLGPGDVLNLSLYGEPELARTEVPIGPDGRISFLEANDVMAAGLTVDELREKLNEELANYRRTPQAFVVPVAYKSKKYFVLGRVMQRGAFPLDRPTSLLEAVARAGGMEAGVASDRSILDLPDLSRSFLARGGRRVPVDFERLFLHGDLSQNVPLEPDDYVYFPSRGEMQVYVLGAVRTPGAHVFHSAVGALGAISARGGFTDRAWTKKLLVVRGGLGAPETFQIDALDVLSGRRPDVALQPRDIVYVSDRPWIYAEELLDAATNAFVTSAIVMWTGEKITRDPR